MYFSYISLAFAKHGSSSSSSSSSSTGGVSTSSRIPLIYGMHSDGQVTFKDESSSSHSSRGSSVVNAVSFGHKNTRYYGENLKSLVNQESGGLLI